MARSLKKPPFVHYKLQMRVDDAQENAKKGVIKKNTAARKKSRLQKKINTLK